MDEDFARELTARLTAEAARQGPPHGFPQLPDIPAGRYTDRSFLELEVASVFRKSWLFAGHTDQLSEQGRLVLWRDAGIEIILLRDERNIARAYYNTCSHRGAPLVTTACGQVSRLQCTYHGWTYDLDGQLIGVPDRRDFVGLDTSRRGLVELRCECWGSWIFVNFNPQAEPLKQYLGRVVDDFRQFKLPELRFYERHSIDIAANWKVCTDAFMEVYHLPHVHPDTVHELLDHRASVMGLLNNGHSRMFTRHRHGPQPVDPEVPEITSVGQVPRFTNMAYSLFPNFVVPLNPQGFPVLLFWPQAVNRTRMDVWWFGPQDGHSSAQDRVWEDRTRLTQQWRERIEQFDLVLREDTEYLPSVQRSMESPAFTGVPLSYQERRLYHAHEAVDDCIGRQQVPADLAVASRLADWVED